MTKKISFVFSVLILSFAFGYFIFAWTEPSQSPPEGNVPTPINVGIEPQAKTGRISATEFYDYNNPAYLVNPDGQSFFSEICFDSDCKSSWPSAELPSGMIAMFDTSCPSGWTRITALDGKFLVAGTTYNTSAGGSDSVTLTINQIPSHTHPININDPGHSHASETPHNNRCVSHDRCDHYNEADVNWVPRTTHERTGITATASNTGGGQPFDNRPAFATIVVCRKN